MRRIILLLLIFSNSLFSQIDFEKHIESIKRDYYESEDRQGVFNTNERAIDYALRYLQDNSIQEKYITNRKFLTKIESIMCKDSSNIFFYKKLENNSVIDVKIKFKKFNAKKHSIKEIDDVNHIDSQIAFGAYYGTPKLEIDCFKIIVNGKSVIIPESVYKKFYEVTQCEGYLFYEPVQVYSSNDGKYIFVYLKGGNAADTYFAKLIFNQEKYITEIVADYLTLLEWRAFNNKDFIGF